jgi:hypothetical protein
MIRSAGSRRPLGLLLVAALCVAPHRAPAQTQAMVLQLRPRAGDTLRLRLDQTIEMGEPTRTATESAMTTVTSLVMLARIAVESADLEGATVVALTDSVRITSAESYESSPVLRAARALQGQRFRFRVAADGATTVGGTDAWASPAVAPLLSQLPATLPREPVAPGQSWARTVEIPLAATPDGRATATLTATFLFDSLSRSGEFAYLSMKGRLLRSGPMQGASAGGFVQTSGSVNGTILIDRRRGWITDARTVISLRSLVSPKGKETSPVRVRMKITQWMRVM